MLGGLQGSTQLLKPSFTAFNPGQTPTLNQLLPSQGYVRTVVAAPTPPPVPNGIQPPVGYTPPSGPSALEVAGAGAATVGMWGSIKAGAVAAAAAAKGAVIAATPYVVAVVTSPYVVVPAVIGGGAYIGYKLGTRSVRLREEAAQAARESVAHRQIHETVHTPTPQPTPAPQSHSTSHPSEPLTWANPNLPTHLQPSPNPLTLGIKPSQPGPKPGQGDHPHGYKDDWGHYKDYTQDNVHRALECVTNGVYHGQNNKGHIFTFTCPETGWQRWTYIDNNGQILNCGINKVHATWDPIVKDLRLPAGFKKPKGKGHGWVKGMMGIGATAISDVTSAGLVTHSAQWDELESTLKNIISNCHGPNAEELQEIKDGHERAIKNTLQDYHARLDPNLTTQQRMAQVDKAEKFLRKQDL